MREVQPFEKKMEDQEKRRGPHDTYVVVDDGTPSPEQGTGTFFLNRYKKIIPTASFIKPDSIRQALRVNTLRTSHELLLERLDEHGAKAEKIPFLKHGYFVLAKFSFGATPEYLLGHYYLQAPLSQLACEVLNPKPNSTVLDMCSAPGSKTTYLASMLTDGGKVIALDSNPDRLSAVRNNVERLGLSNVVCVKKDARFADDFGVKFDYILLDAPCSGNFCSEEGWCTKRTIQDIKDNAKVQRELIKSALNCLAPGGRLLYSTCSLEPEENELVIDYALNRDSALQVIPLNLPIGDSGVTTWEGIAVNPQVANTKRFWPHKTGMEGFYMALIEKKA